MSATDYSMDVIGGVAPIPDTCVGDVVTAFYRQNGMMNEMISRSIELESPLLRLGNMTKKQFPAGQGSVHTKIILTSTSPKSSVGKDWTALKPAYPGGPVPTCRTPQVVRYGHLKHTACLEKFSLRTEDFNSVDLTFQFRRDQQWTWLMNQILPNWSLGVQKFWYRAAYAKNVWNILVGSGWRLSAQMGDYATWAKPTSVLNPGFLDEMYRFLGGYGAHQTPFTTTSDGMKYHALVTGPDEARRLEMIDRAENVALGSVWNDELVIPGYGKVRRIRNWVIFVEDDITRLGENPDGTLYEVERMEDRAVLDGIESTPSNPDYDNPAIAKYTQSIIWNISATDWFLPPDFTQFPNQRGGNWNGTFRIINFPSPGDPLAENAYYLADFAYGMGVAVDGRRGAVLLSLAVNLRGKDICECDGVVLSAASPVYYAVRDFAVDPYTDRLIFYATEKIPASCAAQYSLYLVTSKGLRAQIQTVVYRGESTLPYEYSVALANPAVATVRECDPWVSVACLPNYEPTTVSADNDCALCGPTTDAAPLTCNYTATISGGGTINNIRLADGTQLNDEAGFAFPYTTGQMGALDTALETYLAAHGGGSVAIVGGGSAVITVNFTGVKIQPSSLVGSKGSLNFSRSNCV